MRKVIECQKQDVLVESGVGVSEKICWYEGEKKGAGEEERKIKAGEGKIWRQQRPTASMRPSLL